MNEYRPPAEDQPTERIPRIRPRLPPLPPRMPPPPGPPREPPQVIPRDPRFRPPPPPPPPPRRYPPPPPRQQYPPRPLQRPPEPTRRTLPPQQILPAQPPRPPARPTRAADAAPPNTRPPRRPPPKTKHTKATRRRTGIFRRITTAAFTVVFLAVTAVMGISVWVEASLRRVAVFTDYDGRPAASAGTNWLLVGSDSRADLTEQQQAELSTGGEVGSGRTDTILLVHIPSLFSGEHATMVSIPRDSYVDIPGYGMDKLNAAFIVGGPPLLAQTVEQSTGLRLDHYAELGFAGFGGVVDALGGVTVCPSDPINDPLAGIDLPAGCQVLDGPNALGYVRSRATPRADLDRMLHQREFMSAMLHRAASPAVWLNPWRWYAVPHAGLAALTVDAQAHVWDLAQLGWALNSSASTVTVPIGEFTANEAGAVVVWEPDAAGALFEALRTDAAIPQQVLDGQP